MRSARIAALVIIAGTIAAGLAVDASDDDQPVAAHTEVVAGVALPTARAEPALSSTWFCAGGTGREGGIADHVVLIANPTDRPRTALVTVLTGVVSRAPSAADAPTTTAAPATTAPGATTTTTHESLPTAREVEVPAQSRVEVRLRDIDDGRLVGAVVEVDGGSVVVEHSVTGELGRSTAPCVTTASSTWSFPWGVTTRGNRELMIFMNPFPDDATVDISFATDEGIRDTARFQGFVVPGRSVVGAYIDEDVTRKSQVSAQVQVRGGRLVVDRIQLFDGTDGRRGITLGAGVPTPAETWLFPAGETGPGLREQVVVFNPSEDVAEVEVEVRLDEPGEAGPPEPFELTVPPGRYSLVNLHDEDRVPDGIGHAIVVRSLNGVPVTAERVNTAMEPAANRGISSTTGSPLAGPTWIFAAAGPTEERDVVLVLFNESNDQEVGFRVTGVASGQTIAVQDLQSGTIPAGGRTVIRLGNHISRDNLAIVISADGPIVAERGLYRIGGLGLSQSIGVPLDDMLVIPDPLNL